MRRKRLIVCSAVSTGMWIVTAAFWLRSGGIDESISYAGTSTAYTVRSLSGCLHLSATSPPPLPQRGFYTEHRLGAAGDWWMAYRGARYFFGTPGSFLASIGLAALRPADANSGGCLVVAYAPFLILFLIFPLRLAQVAPRWRRRLSWGQCPVCAHDIRWKTTACSKCGEPIRGAPAGDQR